MARNKPQAEKNLPGRVLKGLLLFILIAMLVLVFRIVLAPLSVSPMYRRANSTSQGTQFAAAPPLVETETTSPAYEDPFFRLKGKAGRLPPPTDRQSMLQDLSRIFGGIPFVSYALGAMAEFLPVLLALYLLKNETNPSIQRLWNFSKYLALFHFGIYFLPAMNSLFSSGPIGDSVTKTVARILQVRDVPFDLGLNTGAVQVGIIVLGVLLPYAAWQWASELSKETEPDRPSKKEAGRSLKGRDKNTFERFVKAAAHPSVNIVLFVLVVALGIALPVYKLGTAGIHAAGCGDGFNEFLWDIPGNFNQLFAPDLAVLTEGTACLQPNWAWAALLMGGILALVLRWLIPLAVNNFQLAVPPILVWVCVLLLLGVCVGKLPTLWNYDFNPARAEMSEGKLWFALVAVLGLALTASLARLAYYGLKSVVRWEGDPPPSAIWLTAPFVVIFSIPTLGFVDSGEPLGRFTDIYQLAYRVDNLLIFLWIAAAAYVLYLDGRKDLNLARPTRIIVILASGLLLFGLSPQFMYLPVAYLLGVLILWWITDLSALQDQPMDDPNKLRDWIKTYSLVRLSEQLYGGFRREKTKKLAKTEDSLKNFLNEIGEYEEIKKGKEALLPMREDGSRINPLAFGPYSSAWSNGLHGLSWSLILALPWILVYTFSFLGGTKFSATFPLLSFAADIVVLVGMWAAIGFVMGYFFPYLRGSSGLQKGLVLGLVLIVARMPLNLAYNRGLGDWQAVLIFSMQVFVQCLLLGLLAFDFYTLNKHHFSFQQLLEIHGLSGLGIWVSSLAVAVGAAITPLLASQTQVTGIMKLLANVVGRIVGVDVSDLDFLP